MNEIPIKNIYYMVLYAWDKIDNKDLLNDKSLEKLQSSNEVIIELFLNEVIDYLSKVYMVSIMKIHIIQSILKGKYKYRFNKISETKFNLSI